VRSYDNEDQCVVVGTFHDWLWLDPVDYRDAAPFTGRAEDYELWSWRSSSWSFRSS